MIIDSLLEFSDKQALAAGATALSQKVCDVFVAGSPNGTTDLGAGEPVWLVVALAGKGAAATGVLSAELVTDDDEAMGAAQVLGTSGEVDVALLKAGQYVWATRLPSAGYKKYLALRYKANGAAANLCVNAFMTKDVDANHAYVASSAIR